MGGTRRRAASTQRRTRLRRPPGLCVCVSAPGDRNILWNVAQAQQKKPKRPKRAKAPDVLAPTEGEGLNGLEKTLNLEKQDCAIRRISNNMGETTVECFERSMASWVKVRNVRGFFFF